jgi:hypothetical protein
MRTVRALRKRVAVCFSWAMIIIRQTVWDEGLAAAAPLFYKSSFPDFVRKSIEVPDEAIRPQNPFEFSQKQHLIIVESKSLKRGQFNIFASGKKIRCTDDGVVTGRRIVCGMKIVMEDRNES